MTDAPIIAAIAERMNRLTQVDWDRCVLHDNSGVAYGWIERPDDHADFVCLDFSWGTTTGLKGESVPWLAVGITTSSADHSLGMAELLEQAGGHKDCERVEDVFGESVKRRIELAGRQ